MIRDVKCSQVAEKNGGGIAWYWKDQQATAKCEPARSTYSISPIALRLREIEGRTKILEPLVNRVIFKNY